MFFSILVNSMAKYIFSISFRELISKINKPASFIKSLCEIHPANLTDKTLLKFITNETYIRPKLLLDLWCVDYPQRYKDFRFQVNYLFLLHQYNCRLRQYLFTNYFLALPSLTDIYPSANWLEREVWDLFGVLFYGHPDLRQILTDYGFEGKPMRKDFPVVGYTQIRYDDGEKRILYEPIQLNQDFRNFSFPIKKSLTHNKQR